MHKIKMREHGDNGTRDVDVRRPGACECCIHTLVRACDVTAVLEQRQFSVSNIRI